MDYRKVQLFLAAARYGNLTEAAASMEISQPALSKSIKALELKEAQVVVRPNLTGVSSADFNARLRAIEAGRAAMLAALPALKAALAVTR